MLFFKHDNLEHRLLPRLKQCSFRQRPFLNPVKAAVMLQIIFKKITFNICRCWLKGFKLSWQRPLSYRNQSIDLWSKSMDWFLYDNSLRHERIKCRFDIWNTLPSKKKAPRCSSLMPNANFWNVTLNQSKPIKRKTDFVKNLPALFFAQIS